MECPTEGSLGVRGDRHKPKALGQSLKCRWGHGTSQWQWLWEVKPILFKYQGTSLVAQWLGVCLPVRGTRVWSLVREDPTCCGAAKPVHHNYWACALEPASYNYWAHTLQLLKSACSRVRVPQLLSPRAATTEARVPRACALQREAAATRSPHTAMKSSPRSQQLEKALVQQRRPNTAKKK